MVTTRNGFRSDQVLRVFWALLIIAVATLAGMLCGWRLPGLGSFAQDWLMRERGELAQPDDIVIVAIDDPSIAALGRFPWTRSYTADVVDSISSVQPKVIALDVVFSEPTTEADDRKLSESIKRAGNVVVGEQLIEDRDIPETSRSVWLKSLPDIESSAAGVGHSNVESEADGTAREMLLKLADDDSVSRWALALETVRVGDRAAADDMAETRSFVRIGQRKVPIDRWEKNYTLKASDGGGLSIVQPLRMLIDYVGPTGSFAAQTYSFADVLNNKIPTENFRDKYVLIGATAATLGDRIATPFVHTENADGDQHGDFMPGVEILANQLNTILRNRYYTPLPEMLVIFWTAFAAAAVVLLLGYAQGRSEALKQIGGLAVLLAMIVLSSYLVYDYFLIIPPLIPSLTSFVVAVPLTLLRRGLAASSNLDDRIGELLDAENRIFINAGGSRSQASPIPISNSETGFELPRRFGTGSWSLPRGLEWKSNVIGLLSRDLIDRAAFIDSALRSIQDGLLIADADGRITFANRSAQRIFGRGEKGMIGTGIFNLLPDVISDPKESWNGSLDDLSARETGIEHEIVIGNNKPCYYRLHMSTVPNRDGKEGIVLGIVATLSDITHHRELDKTKNDVIALVTHELRTPLTAIQGMSEVLTEHDVEAESRRKLLQLINTESKRLARMIDEYLDITRLQSGAQMPAFSAVDIGLLVERTILLLDPLAIKRGIKIANRFPGGGHAVMGDAERLGQVLTNIIANSIKYSPPQTTIIIAGHFGVENVEIVVIDKGFGIPSDQLPRIFEKFYRAARSADDPSGTGLGLALAKEIIELHSGSISAESEPGKGSIFTISLPLSRNF